MILVRQRAKAETGPKTSLSKSGAAYTHRLEKCKHFRGITRKSFELLKYSGFPDLK
jgi:hypothetical protein